MQALLAPATSALPRRHGNPPSASTPPAAQTARLLEFEELRQAFLRTGGMASGDQLAAWMRPDTPQPISQLARWIVTRRILSFQWEGQTLVPLFQFRPGLVSLQPGMAALMRELAEMFDDWELALWFARANSSLADAAPAERLAGAPTEVWQAARLDRFIAAGC